MKKILLILNPWSGQRKANKLLTEIIDIFNRADFTVITHITACNGDAEAAAMRYAPEVDRIVCCGGDGTFNETISGVLKSGLDIPIGYIPAGSTNDVATSLGLSSNILQAARNIVNGDPQPMDVGSFSGRYFSYIASFGAFTRASYATPQSLKNSLGHAAYLLSGIQELSQLRPYPVRLELPDGTVIEDNFIFGAVSNSTSIGGILTLSPADMRDGKFELLLIRTPKDLFELSDCVRALQQCTYNNPMITFLNVTSVKVSAPSDMGWTLDGEQASGNDALDICCLHHAIRVFGTAKQ